MKRTYAITRLAATCLATMLASAGCAAAHSPGHPTGPGRPTGQGQPTGPGQPTGTVAGRFLMEGGPMQPNGQQLGPRPIPGTVVFTGGPHRVIAVQVGRSGRFSVRLPAGTYHAQGRSPRIIEVTGSTRRETPCSAALSVTVAPRHTSTITLVCIVP